jgi:DNA helicase-2/ATP-dependent DNA helicase PcrA
MKKYKLKKLVQSKVKKEYKIKYEQELNSAQLKTVETLEGPLLVIAGAGSGKTRTLIYRVARLVEDGINPENVLLLTFTRKASQEMLKRASQILDNRCGKIAGGTFHSFGNLILRKYAQLIGFNNNFTILDRSDSEDVINIIRANLMLFR